MTKEEIKEYNHQYYLKNKARIIEQSKSWSKENKAKRSEISRKWSENNIEKVKASRIKWRENNQDYDVNYNKTKSGRAHKLITAYKHSDKMYNRGECSLTAQWVVDNIFTKSCHYCGETDWTKLGCDRIDNSKPHTEDNVVPCCKDCNIKKMHKDYKDFINNG